MMPKSPSFSEDSLFYIHDPRKDRWAIPYHIEALNQRSYFLMKQHPSFFENSGVLDLGCHFGTWSYLSLQLGAKRITGIDSDAKLIDQANKFFHHYQIPSKKYSFLKQDVMTYLREQPDHSVDVILCMGLLYYLPDPYFALQEMTRVCRKGLVLDTFTAKYGLIQGKDAEINRPKFNEESLQIPLLLYSLTQSDKRGYTVAPKLKPRKKPLSFLTTPTLPLLELWFQSLNLDAQKVDWTPILKNPQKSWKDLITPTDKKISHWTDIYASNVRVSFILKPF